MIPRLLRTGQDGKAWEEGSLGSMAWKPDPSTFSFLLYSHGLDAWTGPHLAASFVFFRANQFSFLHAINRPALWHRSGYQGFIMTLWTGGKHIVAEIAFMVYFRWRGARRGDEIRV